MYSIKKNILVFFVILILGTVLGTMGTISFPIGSNMSYFWPAAVIQTVSGILFGWWGVFAATLFPSISNVMTDGNFIHVFGLLPINFIQSALPYLLFKQLNICTRLNNLRDICLFVIFSASIPHLIGGMLGCFLLFFFGAIPENEGCWLVMKTWWIGNIPCSVIFGFLIIKYFTPALKLSQLLNKDV